MFLIITNSLYKFRFDKASITIRLGLQRNCEESFENFFLSNHDVQLNLESLYRPCELVLAIKNSHKTHFQNITEPLFLPLD